MAFVASVAWIDLVCGEVVALLQVPSPLGSVLFGPPCTGLE
jgi:hypothetical protein